MKGLPFKGYRIKTVIAVIPGIVAKVWFNVIDQEYLVIKYVDGKALPDTEYRTDSLEDAENQAIFLASETM